MISFPRDHMETDSDFRILMAELAVKRLKEHILSKSTVSPGLGKDRVNSLTSIMDSRIKSMKYSYLEANDLATSDMVQTLFNAAKDLYLGNREAIEQGMAEKPRANLLWSFNVLGGLGRRLKNQGKKPTDGIDIVAVKIRNVTKGDKLYTTKVVAGPREMTVVTNIDGLSTGDTLRAGLLPPVVVGGVVSEAMFLGSEKIDDEAGSFLDAAELDTKEADGILFNELK